MRNSRTSVFPNTCAWEHAHPLSPGGDNINKNNMVIFYKTWKKCHEIQSTKNKMNLNKSKIKNIKAQLELEPNFPRVATPQSSE